ncbi:ricin-type beta-trefoil lectin domain protein [Streptomyces sp. SL13]|uniref:Ricin-type beta-trefoil lectin domain protein n=1 Tax=Streptantibioticus silvisoli TaxID=2705255 RepID=A0AA90H552_9ACTN|nr:ricin-type beta-trefoil lectin domain protein [Streptantibioticus silvisoli]MDI5964359.1 ricin-type beta-trefoil lectin domain protein [Streptantibioticus silvisoli]MDI5969005.1 ricin-type beta-trefoil lectin domain protein [Streptantibioticus silvisoli]
MAVGLLAVFAAFPTAANATTVPAPPSGWSTVFSDGFSGGSGAAPSGQWMYDTGPGSNFGTGEIETMTNSSSNVHLDGNGHLDITALKSGSAWTSGRIQTTSANVGAPAGGKLEVTASIQQPNASGSGYWPAFWMLGPGQWPENGEIDIMEDVNSLSDVAGTIHCGTDPGGPCNESNGIGSGLRACSGCQSGFHTYSMILDRTNTSNESITFYLDGTSYFSVSESQVGASTWQAAYDHNLSIIFDLAMGGGFPNGQCGCTTPSSSTSSGGTMSVAYVAAYTTGGGGTTPPPSGGSAVTGPGGLCLDDRSGSTADYNPVQVYTCNGSTAQQWSFVQAGTTLHVLGKCLDVSGAGTADGTLVDLYDCNNTGSQVWIPQSDGALYNPQSNKCLDDPNGSTTPGTQVQIWDCNGSTAQVWHLPS